MVGDVSLLPLHCLLHVRPVAVEVVEHVVPELDDVLAGRPGVLLWTPWQEQVVAHFLAVDGRVGPHDIAALREGAATIPNAEARDVVLTVPTRRGFGTSLPCLRRFEWRSRRRRIHGAAVTRWSGGCGEILSSRSRRRGPVDGRIVGGAAGVGRSWGRHPARRIASLGGFRLPLTHHGGERRRRPAGHGTTKTQQMNETMEEWRIFRGE